MAELATEVVSKVGVPLEHLKHPKCAFHEEEVVEAVLVELVELVLEELVELVRDELDLHLRRLRPPREPAAVKKNQRRWWRASTGSSAWR